MNGMIYIHVIYIKYKCMNGIVYMMLLAAHMYIVSYIV